MAIRDIGALHGADEGMNHQIIDTFATVSESDLAWTEKIWVSIASTDGSVQADFGLGKYPNRGIIDGFAGVSRGREQWTVRASRELYSAPEAASIGPLVYDIVDPLKSVRVRLEPNDIQPISFDLVLTGVTPPFFEDRNMVRNRRTGRVEVNVVRYHQGGWVKGTITVAGQTYQLDGENCFGFRDHSWGVRQGVGNPVGDLSKPPERTAPAVQPKGEMKWSPMFFGRPDGSHYEASVQIYGGGWSHTSAHINEDDGRQTAVRSAESKMEYDTRTRFVKRGQLLLVMEDGVERTIEVEALGESGFFLKPGGYGPWKGHKHGVWMGKLHLDGEHIADTWDDEMLAQLGQLRDTPIRVREGDAVGYGIMESLMMGEWPEFGLTAESDRRVQLM